MRSGSAISTAHPCHPPQAASKPILSRDRWTWA